MPRPWLKDAVFISLCLAGLSGLVLGVAWPRGTLAADRTHPDRALPSLDPDIATVAASIDAALATEQSAANVEVAPTADTLLVARRLSLALTGTIPSLEELRALEAVPDDRARAWWIEHVLADRRSADYLAERLARALVGTQQGDLIAYRRRRFVAWLSDQLAEGRGWDATVRAMLTGSGLWTQHPETNFMTAALETDRRIVDEELLATRVSRALLGVRLDCAQCHDHPFDERWTQRDFQGLAAFFGGSELTLRGVQSQAVDYVYADQATKAELGIAPQVPFAAHLLPDAASTSDERERLADWVTDRRNRMFARAMANRMWALMLGRGLVEPVDDLPIDPGADADAGVPAALELLADDFAAHAYDLRRLIRVIATTQAFARQSRAPAGASDEDLEARLETWAEFPLTRLRPEQVVGALLQAASLQTIDHESHVLTQLARFSQQREFIARYGDAGEDELEADAGGTIPQRLLMLNGELVHERTKDDLVANAASRIATLTDDDALAVEVAYLAVLTRRPTPSEAAHFEAALAGLEGAPRRAALADLYWVLVNTTEFAWNH